MERLIELARSPDHRVASVVTLGIWERCYGKPTPFDPRSERPQQVIDVSKISSEDLLLRLLRGGIIRDATPEEQPPEQQQSWTIEATPEPRSMPSHRPW